MKVYLSKIIRLLILFIVCNLQIAAQEKSDVKFGKVELQDFDVSKYKFDADASALILANIGETSFIGNNVGWFSIEFTKKTRIKILKQTGVEAANFQIPLNIGSSSNDKETVSRLKAYTYNIENGKVVATPMKNDAIFIDKKSADFSVQKFTLPAVKEGSIIEVSYTVVSPYLFNLRDWYFQSTEYPTVWSEYNLELPYFFNYAFIRQGYVPFHINKQTQTNKTYNPSDTRGAGASENYSITSVVYDNKWVTKDVPALKEESFTSTLENHVTKIEFQLSEYRFPNEPVKPIMTTWPKVYESRMEREDFGLQLKRANNFFEDDIKIVTANATTKYDKCKRIYYYIRDNFTTTTNNGTFIDENNSLRNVFKTKSGTVAEINMLLVAMLQHEKMDAHPVLLSTRGRQQPHNFYPIMDRFNYLAAAVVIDTSIYFLDATQPVGFGKLPMYCYNGQARILNQNTAPFDLSPNNLNDNEYVNVFLINNDKGELDGSLGITLGEIGSYKARRAIKQSGEKEFFNQIKKGFAETTTISNTNLDSLQILEQPLAVNLEFKQANFTEDIVYFNPMFYGQTKENPFKALERTYPVEMNYVINETYILNMEIPKGYKIDELPKSTRVKYGDGEGMFEYIIAQTEGKIQFRTRLYFTKALFEPDEYSMLREFFSYVVKKQAEQIVFKKL